MTQSAMIQVVRVGRIGTATACPSPSRSQVINRPNSGSNTTPYICLGTATTTQTGTAARRRRYLVDAVVLFIADPTAGAHIDTSAVHGDQILVGGNGLAESLAFSHRLCVVQRIYTRVGSPMHSRH